MNAPNDEIERRRESAIAAIRREFDARAEDSGVMLFLSHHIEEIGEDYWLKHCGVAKPESSQVLEILEFKSHWGEEGDEEDDEDGIDTFDFTLPGDVTDYVISVEFDEDGSVADISMES